MNRHPRFLVLRGGAVGDLIVTLPALQAIRLRWPEAYIELIGYPRIARLALSGGTVDRVRSLDEASAARLYAWDAVLPPETIEHLQSFDIVFSYLHDPDGTVRENLERAGARQVVDGSPLVRNRHAVDQFFEPLSRLAIYPEEREYPLVVPAPAEVGWAGGWLNANGIGAQGLALHPGSGSEAKNWPADRFLELARHARASGARPFFIIGEADETAREVVARAPEAFSVLENEELERVAAVLAAVRAFVGNDSGISHLAAAVGIPVLALFGRTDPALWAPRGPSVRVLRADLAELPVADVLRAVPEAAWPAKGGGV